MIHTKTDGKINFALCDMLPTNGNICCPSKGTSQSQCSSSMPRRLQRQLRLTWVSSFLSLRTSLMFMCNNNRTSNLHLWAHNYLGSFYNYTTTYYNHWGSHYNNISSYYYHNGSSYYYDSGSNNYRGYNPTTHNYNLSTNDKCSSDNSIPSIKQYSSAYKHQLTSSKLHSREYS